MVKREDLRQLTVCSVDPPGCTDIDDALHCRELDNGNLEVHIFYRHAREHTIKEVSFLCLSFQVLLFAYFRWVSTLLMSVTSSDLATRWTKRLQTAAPPSTCVAK